MKISNTIKARSTAYSLLALLTLTMTETALSQNVPPADAAVNAGGIGGNTKTGALTYDGAPGHLPALAMTVDDSEVYEGINVCKFQNDSVTVQDVSYPDQSVIISSCLLNKNKHRHNAWISLDNNDSRWLHDEVNGGYSPSLDAFYAATITQKLYQDWYGIPVLITPDGKPMQLVLRVHYGRQFENAFWDGKQMTFGDGGNQYYPMTSLDMTAHEISHGFTDQHANINYGVAQMAALHESFSDAAAMAAEYYVTGTNTWAFGESLLKAKGAIRYFNEPTKNGACIDHMKDFKNTEPHAAAGIMNKAFYLIATSPGWNTHKAFNIMVKANQDYWTAGMKTLNEAACGMLAAARDYHYELDSIKTALQKVGIETNDC